MKKILIIEDERIMVDLLMKKLSKEGYSVSAAFDGEEGLSKIRETKPDLVLLDMVMPKMGGIEVIEEVVKDKELKKIPLIVISNSGQPVELERIKELGVKDWLIKTEFDPQEVIEKVKRQLPLH